MVMVTNPVRRGQLQHKNYSFAPENLVSQDGFGRHIPREPAYTQCSRLG